MSSARHFLFDGVDVFLCFSIFSQDFNSFHFHFFDESYDTQAKQIYIFQIVTMTLSFLFYVNIMTLYPILNMIIQCALLYFVADSSCSKSSINQYSNLGCNEILTKDIFDLYTIYLTLMNILILMLLITR